MSNYNHDFEDKMDEVNNLAKSKGFTNGIEWADAACKKGKSTMSSSRSMKVPIS